MSGRVYTARFYGPGNLTATTGVTLFTVPTGHVFVVRNVLFVNNNPTVPVSARLAFGTVAAPGSRIVNVDLAPNASASVEMRLPFVAGESMSGILSVAQSTACTVSGYDFLV